MNTLKMVEALNGNIYAKTGYIHLESSNSMGTAQEVRVRGMEYFPLTETGYFPTLFPLLQSPLHLLLSIMLIFQSERRSSLP